jgi:predicted dithiol-disulfide oxidoreductase (DUF899 family)
MRRNAIVSGEAWLAARKALLEQEKTFTRARDKLSAARRALPWVEVEQDYRFDTVRGIESLADLFDGCSQLIVYHFMFGPDWQEGCPSCSFWADNYQGTLPHLRARDINLVTVSRAPLENLQSYRERMGWTFDWVSSAPCRFNFDFAVSFEPGDDSPSAPNYNFATQSFDGAEAPGLSVFVRDEKGEVYHTYSCYSRGLDMLNGAYHHIDLVPKGRDEQEMPWPMAWVKRHDRYTTD